VAARHRFTGSDILGSVRLLLLALCGCSSVFGLHDPARAVDGGVPDVPIDGSRDDGPPADAPMCFGTGEYTVCFDALPTDAATYTGTVNTATAAACATNVHWMSASQPDSCFLAGTNVMLSDVTLTGARPVVVVATGTVTVMGLVDASSHRAATTGAGTGSPACNAPDAAQEDTEGGAGGAGGSYGTLGGNGGKSSNGMAGGAAAAAGAITSLHGGCRGAPGAKGGGGQSGAPGMGGGALYIVAGNNIVLGASTIAANGAGAGVAQNRWGGAGGGTGGMLVLQAPAIAALSATLMANGGGGASGASGGAGTPGADPSTSSPLAPAPGGTGNADGGNGYAASSPAAAGMASPGGTTGGGGGGGGGGYIRANVAIDGATASPAIDVIP
jgi:hypothetical protein